MFEPEQTRGAFKHSAVECKSPVARVLTESSLDLEPPAEEFTEVVAFTEEQSESEQGRVSEDDPHDLAAPLGTIEEESELELERAIPDLDDPEVLTVTNKSGQRVKIRKGFSGARIVDLENRVDENELPIDSAHYHIPSTIVNEYDPHLATLTSHRGHKVRVKRNFQGARILDLENKVCAPHADLIGRTILEEGEFAFHSACPDPEDPEAVMVTHNPTGEHVKVRKTFHNAQVIDHLGNPVPSVPGIDRNKFDISRTVVDKEDVHIATLRHRLTDAHVRVRRNFRGAKIVDLERKAEFPKLREERVSSPQLSGTELPQEHAGWVATHIEDSRMFEKRYLGTLRDPARERLANLGSIISHLEEEKREFQSGVDSDEEFGPSSNSALKMNQSISSIASGVARRKRKKKKHRGLEQPSGRIKGLESIYLQRLETHKKAPSRELQKPHLQEFFEAEWEDNDFSLEPPQRAQYGPIQHAGDEIAFGRRK